MKLLAQASGSQTQAGSPLPVALPGLARLGVTLRKGHVTMIAAPPNGGKSLLALWYAVKAQVPTLYISADTDQTTTLVRAAAILSGDTCEQIEDQLQSEAAALVEDVVADADHLAFTFHPSPSLQDIEDEVTAVMETWGRLDLLIIDNLMNVAEGTGNEWADMRELMRQFHHVARVTEAAVWVLHHTTEGDGQPDMPAARRSIQGKVAQFPEQVLTVAARPTVGELAVACVKNRNGPHDPTGGTFATFPVDFSRMTIYDTPAEKQRADSWRQYQ